MEGKKSIAVRMLAGTVAAAAAACVSIMSSVIFKHGSHRGVAEIIGEVCVRYRKIGSPECLIMPQQRRIGPSWNARGRKAPAWPAATPISAPA